MKFWIMESYCLAKKEYFDIYGTCNLETLDVKGYIYKQIHLVNIVASSFPSWAIYTDCSSSMGVGTSIVKKLT